MKKASYKTLAFFLTIASLKTKKTKNLNCPGKSLKFWCAVHNHILH